MFEFENPEQWESWLAEHHADADDAWLRIGKKGSAIGLITIEQAAQVGHCYGWIDSHRRSYDEHSFLQRYSRRRRRSPWSTLNIELVRALIAAGRMRAPGLAEVAAAQADGRWAAADHSQIGSP